MERVSIPPSSCPGKRHYGLVGMKERVQAVGGRFHLESTLGKGTRLQIQIPRRVSAAQSVMLGA